MSPIDISLDDIHMRYQHLYIEDGPVPLRHLRPTVVEKVRHRHSSARLVGLAPASPKLPASAITKVARHK